jgi:hypothetical protein
LDKGPDVGAPLVEPLADPLQKGRRRFGDGVPFDKSQQHVRLGVLLGRGLSCGGVLGGVSFGRACRQVNAIASQCLRIFFVGICLALDKTKRLSGVGLRAHLRLGESTPPDLVQKTERPVLVLFDELNQAVSLFF